MRAVLSVICGLGLLIGAAAKADISLLFADDTAAVIYRSGDHIIYEGCPGKGNLHPERGCSGDKLTYGVTRDLFVRRVNGFFGVDDKDYSGQEGLVAISRRIERTRRALESGDLTESERNHSQRFLKSIESLQAKLVRAKKDLLDYVEKGKDRHYDEELQRMRVRMLVLLFCEVAYDSETSTVYRLVKTNAPWTEAAWACRLLGTHWQPIDEMPDPRVRGVLTRSALLVPRSSLWVWTTESKAPQAYVEANHLVAVPRKVTAFLLEEHPKILPIELEKVTENGGGPTHAILCRSRLPFP